MKTNRLKSSGIALNAIFLGIVLLLASCAKDSGADYVKPMAAFSIVNTFSGSSSVDFYLDNQKINTQPLLYKQNTVYIQAFAGDRRLTITNSADISNSASSITFLDEIYPFEGGKYYSVFLAKDSSYMDVKMTKVVAEDDLTPPTAGKAKVRLVHLIPTRSKIDVYIKGELTPIITGSAFKTASAFVEVNAGTVDFEIREHLAGTSENFDEKLELSFSFESGKIYTISTNGVYDENATDDLSKFGIQVIKNN